MISYSFPELGDHYDNRVALDVAEGMIKRGMVKEGLKIVEALHDHIERTNELKSRHWLTPQIEHILTKYQTSLAA